MKNIVKSIVFFSSLLLVFSSCDKVDFAYEKTHTNTVDESLFPGDWDDYLTNYYPEFEDNENTNVNVLIEDYTGHRCPNCPPAGDEAHALHIANPNRVFTASIHIDPGAKLTFQKATPNADKYYTDFVNDDAIAYGKEFENGFNFLGNPQGTVNRKMEDAKMFDFYFAWEGRANSILSENNLKVNLQSVFNYFPETNGGFLHVEAEKLTDETLDINTVVYVLKDSLVDWQTMPDNSDNEFYIHRDIHIGSIDNNPWGTPTFTAENESGDKVILDYSYEIPEDMTTDNMHFLIYVYEKETYEILQVIKQKVEE